MPEQPDKTRRTIEPLSARPYVSLPYAELYCKTNFSFLEGASHPDELVYTAAKLGYRALAITDRHSLAGVVRAHSAAKDVSLKLLIGSEVSPLDAPGAVLLATDRKAYGRLSQLLAHGKLKSPKGECRLTFGDVATYAEGLIACVLGAVTVPELCAYREVFADRCYLLAHQLYETDDLRELTERQQIAKKSFVPMLASNRVHFHIPERRPLADVLTAIRAGCTVADAGDLLLPNAERHLKSPEKMRELFAAFPDALRRTVEIAGRCHFSLDELRYDYPEELTPPRLSPIEHLKNLTWQGAAERYPVGIPERIEKLIHHELGLIEELHYEAYFLTVWDLANFANSRGILYQGRGSSANSVVCFCLKITAIAPERLDVLFERFISRERNEPPDIDVDFEHQRREEVLQYIYDKYGRDRAAMTAEVITYRPRSAVRDVGKALGISLDRIDALAKTLDNSAVKLEDRCRLAGLNPRSRTVRQLLGLVGELQGFPRHLGQHVGGMVITQNPLYELVPIENAAMEGRTVIEWDKDDLDEIGILKVDCLALGMLTAVHRCFDLVEKHHQRRLTLSNVPEDDKMVYDMICRADAIGVFQIESRAQLSMLPRLLPRCFYDLVIEIAIVRPGPIQGQMVHPYLKRRAGEEEPYYPNDEIKAVLEKTLGVPLFQEQAMKLAMTAAGFTPGQADQLRRAMTAWRKPGIIDEFSNKLIAGMKSKGYSQEFAETVFKQIRGFGEYGFPESHAASFALIAYVSAYLKCHYPAAFCVALMNSQPMGFYAPAQLIADARQHGVEVRPIDVNSSHWESTIEHGAVRLGLQMISGLPRQDGQCIAEVRSGEPFKSIADFKRRTRVGLSTLTRLSRADAFASLNHDRRTSLWHTLGQEKQTQSMPLLEGLEEEEIPSELPAMSRQAQVFADYRTAGFSLKAHPISFFREDLNKLNVIPSDKLRAIEQGTYIRVAGIVLVRQRPGTAKGITFVTLEDETGQINLIIRLHIWEKYYRVARTAPGYIAHGRLQNHKGIIHVLVSKLENLSESLQAMNLSARNFH
jgi:error-prone DNA polymerase